MRAFPFLLLTLLACSTLGCGGATPGLVTKPPPAGGGLVRLPRDRGYVSVKTEAPKSSRNAPGRHRPESIIAVFFEDDGVTPMNPAPTEVSFKVGEAAKARSIDLSPDAGNPSRFVSTPASFPGGLQGVVHAKINGEVIEESFSAR